MSWMEHYEQLQIQCVCIRLLEWLTNWLTYCVEISRKFHTLPPPVTESVLFSPPAKLFIVTI